MFRCWHSVLTLTIPLVFFGTHANSSSRRKIPLFFHPPTRTPRCRLACPRHPPFTEFLVLNAVVEEAWIYHPRFRIMAHDTRSGSITFFAKNNPTKYCSSKTVVLFPRRVPHVVYPSSCRAIILRINPQDLLVNSGTAVIVMCLLFFFRELLQYPLGSLTN